MNKISKILVTILPVLLLVGCSSTKEPMTTGDTGAASTAGQQTGGPGTGAEAIGVPDDGRFQGDPLDDPSSMLADRVIYFDFDKSDVKDKYRALLRVHAAYIARNPAASVVLEGHADERGSREYNIALGERRANAVKTIIKLMGGPSDRVETVSYGEERPVAFGHDESSWSLNRRVEIVYKEH